MTLILSPFEWQCYESVSNEKELAEAVAELEKERAQVRLTYRPVLKELPIILIEEKPPFLLELSQGVGCEKGYEKILPKVEFDLLIAACQKNCPAAIITALVKQGFSVSAYKEKIPAGSLELFEKLM